MAFGYTANRGTSTTLTLAPTATTAGMLFLTVSWTSAAARSLSTVTDTKSNVWTIVQPAGGASESSAVAYCLAPIALGTGDTITIAFSGGTTLRIQSLEEFSGTQNGLDASGTQAMVSSTTATASATASAAGDLAIMWVTIATTTTPTTTTPAGYTALTKQSGSTPTIYGFYNASAGSGSNSPSSTISATVNHETLLLLVNPPLSNLPELVMAPRIGV